MSGIITGIITLFDPQIILNVISENHFKVGAMSTWHDFITFLVMAQNILAQNIF
jgi:hypothetical protein